MHRVDSVIQNTKVQPRPYQRRIVTKVTQMFRGDYVDEHTGESLDNPLASVMIESPTGSGKTVMALLAAKTLQQDNPDLVIGWVCMRRNLLVQAEREDAKHGINLENVHWVSMFDKHPDGLIQARKDGKQILMIVDEAQHDAASSMSHLHNMIEPDLILGMTATPFRTDKMKLCFLSGKLLSILPTYFLCIINTPLTFRKHVIIDVVSSCDWLISIRVRKEIFLKIY